MRPLQHLVLAGVAALATHAATLQEPFESDPLLSGWSIHGDASLFDWDATNGNLQVTWDSSRTNSYFHRPLNNVLTREDDFQVTADLWLQDVATGTTPGKDSTFELAFGLVLLDAMTATNFLRGSGINATHGPRNIVELDYFPESIYGFGETISPTLISSNNQFASSFTFPMELETGTWHHIELTYTASNSTLATVILTNGVSIGTVANTTLNASFTDFRVDTLAVCSYSDAGQTPPAGSILAHGRMDNLAVTMPDPPVTLAALSFTNGLPLVTFQSRSNWTYALERTVSLTDWLTVANEQAAVSGTLQMIDTNPPPDTALYRVRAERP